MTLTSQGYFPVLASAPSSSPRTQTQIQRNVSEILALHEELLTKIRHIVPNSDLRSDLDHRNISTRAARYAHRPSADTSRIPTDPVPTLVHGSFELLKVEHSRKYALVAEPREVALVAKVFERMVMNTPAHTLQ